MHGLTDAACVDHLHPDAGIACVVVADRDGEAAASVAGAIGAADAAVAVTVDVTSEDAVRSAVDDAVLAFGGVDLVVNNAGPVCRAACP